MTHLNYDDRAELYLGRDIESAAAQGPRSFKSAAKAIRFALEEAAPVSLRGASLEVAGTSYSGAELAALYQSAHYPLPRRHSARAVPRHANRGPDHGKLRLQRQRRTLSQPPLRQDAAGALPAFQ